MRSFLRSDLFRNFMGGFALGAVALVALQPAEQRTALEARVAAVAQQL